MKVALLLFLLTFSNLTRAGAFDSAQGAGGEVPIMKSEEEYDDEGEDPAWFQGYSTQSKGFGNGGSGGGMFGVLQQQKAELPENFDTNWYLANPHVPDALKKVLSEDENALNEYALSAHEGCNKLRDNGLLDFFNNEVMTFIRARPKICEVIEKKEITRPTSYWPRQANQNGNFGFISTNQDNMKSTQVKYTTHDFSLDKINTDELMPYEKLLLEGIQKEEEANKAWGGNNNPYTNTGLSIPKPIEEQDQMSDEAKESLKYLFGPIQKDFSKPHQLLIKTMLMRVWKKLSPLHQMQGLRECPTRLRLNNSSLTWDINEKDPGDSDQNLALFKKICNANTMEELLPYLDESVLTEFAFYASDLRDTASVLLPLCLSWPETQTTRPSPLPGVTQNEIIYRASEISRMAKQVFGRRDAIALINQRDQGGLSEDQIKALSDYTANGSYDRINAYEMWGRLGVWYITDDSSNPYFMTLEQYNQYYTKPARENYSSQEQYEKAMTDYLEQRKLMYPHLFGTPEERQKALEAIKSQGQGSYDPMKTLSGVDLSVTSKHLKAALENLDGFKGVTFGGHQLSGHLFKGLSISEGSTFKPGFFMSTSTTQATALNFLGIGRADHGDPRAYERKQNGEEVNMKEAVTGYLFVVRNRQGVPISNYSNFSSENEILLHPDAQYKILKVETLVHEGETYPNAQVVYIEETERH